MEPQAIPLESLVESANGDRDAVTERILRAARHEFELVGIRRSNMIDIARNARVSRATLYRRFQDRDALVEAVFAREMVDGLARIAAQVARSDDAVEAIVTMTVAGLRGLRGHRILRRLRQTEPEEMYQWLGSSDNAALAMTRAFICRLLEPLQAGGQLPKGDLSEPAEVLARVTLSLVLTPKGVIPTGDDAQVAEFVRRYLAPLFTAVTPAVGEA